MGDESKVSSGLGGVGLARLGVCGVMVLGTVGLLSGVAFGSTAGASAPAARPKATVPHYAAAPKAKSHQTVPSTIAGKIGKSAPTVSTTPDIPVATANSKTFTVNTTNDAPLATTGSTTCKASTPTGLCTLRAAVGAANNDHGHVDVIDIPTGTYTLTLGRVFVTNSVIINGQGSAATALSDHTGIFDIQGTTGFHPAVDVNGLTVENGTLMKGGNLFVTHSALTLSGVTVSHGQCVTGCGVDVTGGALWTDSSTTFTSNSAYEGGGAILNTGGAVFLGGSTFTNNAAYFGGAIVQAGALVAQHVTYNGNQAVDGGGAIYNIGSLNDTDSSYTNTSLTDFTGGNTTTYGGVIDNVWNATISGDTVSGTTNHQPTLSTALLGGVFFNGGQMTIDNTTVSRTSNSCVSCTIVGGVVFSATTSPAVGESTLTVTGLTVSGTTNGTVTGTPTIGGGVIANTDSNATLAGLNVSNTINITTTTGVYGAALFSNTWTQVRSSSITGTTDTFKTGGGALGVIGLTSAGSLTGVSVSGTTINAGGPSAVFGGAIDVGTTDTLAHVSVTGTTITIPSGVVVGGAVLTAGTTSAIDSSVSGTSIRNVGTTVTAGVEGGGWANQGSLSLNGVQVLGTSITTSHNVYGGAFGNAGTGAATITNSTFAGTSVTETGTGNVYGAGAAFTAGGTLTNVTIDTNTTSAPATSINSVVDLDTAVQFTNDTVANNTVKSATGGAFNAPAGGLVLTATVPVGLKNTIVANTPSTANCDLAGHTTSFTSAGGNIDSGVTCGFNRPSDQYLANPMVNPVANNSGPVETASLQAGSPAIGHGVSAGCPATDARGVARTGGCDVGAFQTSTQGYWEVASDGGIFTFGTATFHGSEGGVKLNAPIVGMAATPTGGGYWEVAADGGVFTFGNATYYGSMGSKHLNDPIVGMAAAPTGHGYWLAASDGGIFAFGSAVFHGSKGGQPLNKPVVGIAADPTGNGYWEVASDGGIFNYGSAGFFGSKGGQPLNAPVDNIAAAPTGGGYILVATDGGIFNYGSAGFFGSKGGQHLNAPMVGVASTATGQGYWEFAADGGVFTYGTAAFLGFMGGTTLAAPVVGGAALSRGANGLPDVPLSPGGGPVAAPRVTPLQREEARVETLLIDRADGVVTVTMNRPERKNAANGVMLTELRDTFEAIERNAEDRVLVLTGAGGAFCSGADLGDPEGPATNRAIPGLVRMRRLGDVALALHRLNKPTIAKVDGVAVGAGFSLALGCDLVVCSDRARFSMIFAKRGLSLDNGSSWLLPRLIGLAKAKEVALFGGMLDAAEADRLGFVNRVLPQDELDAFVADWAATLAAGPPLALSSTKTLLNQSFSSSMAEAVEQEARCQSVNFETADVAEAMAAFQEKRDPKFTGR